MNIQIDASELQDFPKAVEKEWLETNGLGGYAASTLTGANTRRYHGLLVAATQPPVGRMVLLAKLDETIKSEAQQFELGCNHYDGAVHPHGYRFLHSFEKGLFPRFVFKAGGITLRKTICAVQGENTTLILYEALEASAPFEISFNPLVAGRDFHSLTHANDTIRTEGQFAEGTLQLQPYQSIPKLFVAEPHFEFYPDPHWYYNFTYPVEQYRGLDYREDLFSYGKFVRQVNPGDTFIVVISTENPTGRDAFALFRKEEQRRRQLLATLPIKDEITQILALAANQFIVQRGNKQRSMIAGYHWFADWGRDTMIALPGICLVTGQYSDAKKILRVFAANISRGMLPNRFPDVGETPEYNTVDATLWFFIAIYQYLQYTGDFQFVKEELLPALQDIISRHYKGTRYRIHVDSDGLLYAGEPGVQLTWMDAKVGDWVVTPRQGKAVEINALWYNALKIGAFLLRESGATDESAKLEQQAKLVKKQFQRTFWFNEGGYLYDHVEDTHGDTSFRPNQLFALSLPFPLLPATKAKKILRLIEQKLYTPFGLRSLAKDDPDYRPHYGGDSLSRDGAYHQGTVWSWLLGPYITALVRYNGEDGRKKARQIITDFTPHFSQGCIGSVSEIFDAEPPHHPRGAVAQAWGVAEILRAYVEDVL
jgi:predicted glycogen debranching enzyme